MRAKEQINQLKNEFLLLNSEDEKLLFDEKFKRIIGSNSDVENDEFAEAFVESARDTAKRVREFCEETEIRMKLKDVIGVVSMSYIASRYFNKSKFWFSQKLNGNVKNGAPAVFTGDELKTLSLALDDIGSTLKNTARSIC